MSEVGVILCLLCEAHRNELRQAIRDRGLEPYVSKTDEELQHKFEIYQREGGGVDSFDPYFFAHHALCMQMVEEFPMVLLRARGKCPLCLCVESCTCPMQGTSECGLTKWISHAADDEFERAMELGLIASA